MDFLEYSDEYLVELALVDEAAKEALLRRFKDHVRLISRSYFIVGGEYEDLVQEGMIGLYKAIGNYRADHGKYFKAFATICIKNQILDAIKSASRKKHMPLNDYVSMDVEVPEMAYMIDQTYEPEMVLLHKESEENLRRLIQESLSELEATILHHFVAGLSYEEIAAILGRTTKSVDNALSRVRQKMSHLI